MNKVAKSSKGELAQLATETVNKWKALVDYSKADNHAKKDPWLADRIELCSNWEKCYSWADLYALTKCESEKKMMTVGARLRAKAAEEVASRPSTVILATRPRPVKRTHAFGNKTTAKCQRR